ncbi:MAG TPA: asparagine synthase-related protein, partial [Thermoplasmata archaeon]|nr:asparagine synthase-related protein [Thermoplasmata archaeon]
MNPVMSYRPAGGGKSAEEIVQAIAGGGPALVALSGGTDSAVVAFLARRGLGPEARAVTLVGAAVSAEERDSARASARAIAIPHVLVEADPLEERGYRENPANRCYFCRKVETRALRAYGAAHSIRQYL